MSCFNKVKIEVILLKALLWQLKVYNDYLVCKYNYLMHTVRPWWLNPIITVPFLNHTQDNLEPARWLEKMQSSSLLIVYTCQEYTLHCDRFCVGSSGPNYKDRCWCWSNCHSTRVCSSVHCTAERTQGQVSFIVVIWHQWDTWDGYAVATGEEWSWSRPHDRHIKWNINCRVYFKATSQDKYTPSIHHHTVRESGDFNSRRWNCI